MAGKIKSLNELQREFAKWMYTKRSALMVAPPGKGKCVLGTTRVMTERGYLPVASLLPEAKEGITPFSIKVLTRSGMKSTSHFYKESGCDVNLLSLNDGSKLNGTDKHRVLSYKDDTAKLVRMDELAIGDYILKSREPLDIADSQSEYTQTDAYWLGAWLGDGGNNLDKGKVAWYFMGTKEIVTSFQKDYGLFDYNLIKDRRSPDLYKITIGRRINHPIQNLVGVDTLCNSWTKELPTEVFKWSLVKRVAFLRGIIDTDGSVQSQGQPIIDLTMASRSLVDSIASVFESVGINPVITDRKINGKLYRRLKTRIYSPATLDVLNLYPGRKQIKTVTQNPNLRNVIRVCKSLGKEVNKHRLENQKFPKSCCDSMGNNIEQRGRVTESLLVKYKEYYGSILPELDCLIGYDYVQIIGKTKIMNQDVYDVSVPDGHEFIAQGCANHNTLAFLASFAIFRKRNGFKTLLVITKTKQATAVIKNNAFGFSIAEVKSKKDLYHFTSYDFPHDIYVVTDGQIAKMLNDPSLAFQRKYFQHFINTVDMIVIDELHNYRKYKSTPTVAVKKVTDVFHKRVKRDPYAASPRLITLTATPDYKALENYHQMFAFVKPDLFGPYYRFRDRYCDVEEQVIRSKQRTFTPNGSVTMGKRAQIVNIIGYKNVEELYQLISPFVFKYDKTDFSFTYSIQEYDFMPDEEKEYRKILKGTGLDTSYVLYLDVDKSVAPDLAEGQCIKMVVSRHEHVINEKKHRVSPADIRESEHILYNKSWARVVKIRQKATIGTHSVRLIAAQAQLSKVVNKLALLSELIHPDKGCLIYFQYHASIAAVEQHLHRIMPSRRVVVLTGKTKDMAKVMESLGPKDIVLITRVAQQSVDFYFDQMIIYECITNPGAIEQLFGRLTREDSEFRKIHVDFVIRRKSIEEYFYEFLRLRLRTSRNNIYSGEIPPSESLKDVPQEKINVSFLKEALLWEV